MKMRKEKNGRIKIIDYPMFDDDLWKEIYGWRDYYIHPKGYVKSKKVYFNSRHRTRIVKEKILTIFTVRGYPAVNLVSKKRRKSVRIHLLVARAFVSNTKNKSCVNHKDGNKLNNDSSNLEWCTWAENEQHSYNVLGKKSPAQKISTKQHNKIIKMLEDGIKQKVVAKKFGVTQTTISHHKIKSVLYE